MSKLYDRRGRRISFEEYGALVDQPEYRRVARTELEGGGFVSTVWLGVDHNHSGVGPPIIFETMCFPEGDCERYSTLGEAVEGHARMVAEVLAHRARASLRPSDALPD
jgi:hypothetical protein